MDWFVSLDIEECVYVPKALENSARHYFGSQERTVEIVRLWNHEAVPERQDLHDWFRDSTLFQVSRFHCQGFKPPREYDEILRRREGRAFEHTPLTSDTQWRHDVMVKICECRQSVTEQLNLELPALSPNGEPELECQGQVACVSVAEGDEKQRFKETLYGFQAYTHGKCAVRIMSKHHPPPVPWPGHTFLKDNGSLIRESFQANGNGAAVILHYPNSGFEHWKRKYERQGKLHEAVHHPRLHVASSHVVSNRSMRVKESFYRSFVMQDEQNELAYLAEHGLLIRIDGVRNTLYYNDEPRESTEALPGHLQWVDSNTGLRLARPS
jgi:hypothetical protein